MATICATVEWTNKHGGWIGKGRASSGVYQFGIGVRDQGCELFQPQRTEPQVCSAIVPVLRRGPRYSF